MRMHIIALAAGLALATPAFAGELDQEFKGGEVKNRVTAPQAPLASVSEFLLGSELDDESPTQAHRRWGWGYGYGRGYGFGWGVGYRWGGWGGYGYRSWYRPYYGGYWGYGSYYRPYYASYYYPRYSYSYYPSYGYYGGWGYCY